jgi:hypothetical protein
MLSKLRDLTLALGTLAIVIGLPIASVVWSFVDARGVDKQTAIQVGKVMVSHHVNDAGARDLS